MPTFVDVKKDSFLIDEQKVYEAITPKTKAIITVDIGGVPVDYDAIRAVLKAKNREDITLISLPLYSTLSVDDAEYVAEVLIECIEGI